MQRYVEWVVRNPRLVIVATILLTGALALQVANLRVIIDPNSFLPQSHPYVIGTNQVERVFGSKYVVVVGVTPREGDVFRPDVLGKVHRMTAAILDLPGVVRGNVLSLAARKAKSIAGTADGMDVRPLMETVPETPEDLAALRAAVRANPAYLDTIVSRDERTTAIIAEFRDPSGGFRDIVEKVTPILDRERDGSVEIAMGGLPVFLTHIEWYSQRMAFLFPLAVLITGLIHYEAFRTLQGLILPLVTALLAVVWGLGIMGLAGVPMDIFNATTPILILAVAAGHAVQILKRYYEEYHRLAPDLPAREANRAAVVASVARIGPVMVTAGFVASCGFLSLVVFELSAVRTFGVFTGIGILSALALEMTFIPALRSLLPPPGQRERRRERERRGWDRLAEGIAGWVTGPARRRIYVAMAALAALSALGGAQLVVEGNTKSQFFERLPVRRDDAALNDRLGGTNTLYVLIEGREPDALKDPRVLRAMEATQRFLEQEPEVGKTLSLADFVKRMNRAMHGDDPAFDRIPDSRELVSQYLLLYSMAGEPGDFDTYVDYDYRSANVWVFLKTDSTAYLRGLLDRLQAVVKREFGDAVRVSFGGAVPQAAAVNQAIVQSKTLNIVQIAGVILVIAALVFRSLVAGVLVLVPLVAAVAANFGLMGLAGIPLDVPTSLTSAMAVGIGADYAIYLIFRIREELARGGDEREAIRAALTTAGKAILFVASAVAGGYGMLLFSYGFHIHVRMAILIATAMLVSSVVALTILPSLLLTLRPAFIFGRARGARPATIAAGGLVAALGIAGLAATASAEPDAREVMARNFVVTKVVDSTQTSTITLVGKTGQERVRQTVGVTKLQPNGADNMRMVRFVSPPDVRGTVTLLVEHGDREDDIWIYLPALKKVRRLVASNKKDSFVGTDFSYGDVIGHKVDEWEHRLLTEETVDGAPCYVVESVPRTEAVRASSGYARRISWIRKDNFVQARGEFWDQAGRPLKTARFTDVRLVDPRRDRWQAMRLEATNLQSGHRTVIQFEQFKVDQGVRDEFFTTRYMEREGP